MHVTSARWLPHGPPFPTRRPSAAQAAGLRYEAKAQGHLLRAYGDTYIPSPWFQYHLRGEAKPFVCQLDGLLFDLDRGKIVAVEIKLKHTERAAEQLHGKYLPVLRAVFPDRLWRHASCEVTRYFDRSVKMPVPIRLHSMPDEAEPGAMSVVTYRGNS